MLSIRNLKIHPLVALQVGLDHPQVLEAFPPQADLLLVAAASPVAVEASVVVGVVGGGKSIFHFYNIESRMSYMQVLVAMRK